MNRINPKKLLHSKWTSQKPKNKEKHFLVTELITDEKNEITGCILEAVITNREQLIDWQELQNEEKWLFGWK